MAEAALLLALAAATALAVDIALRGALPWLRRLALARPNERSSHRVPTPQGAGVVIVPLALVAAALAALAGAPLPAGGVAFAAAVAGGALLLAAVGLIDDARALSIGVRLAAQVLAVALVLACAPADMRVLPAAVPLAAERLLVGLAMLWFVNLVNFMDGMDLLSATETFGIGAGIVLLALLGCIPRAGGWWAAALLGAMAGFVRLNAPPARLFLGDAGSLPLGLLLAVLLWQAAAAGAWAAALILPLYYLMDASLTLARRILRRERFWQAHREHFYQRAMARGHSVGRIIAAVAVLDAALVAIAAAASCTGGAAAAATGVAGAVLLVGAALALATRRRP